MVNGTVVALHAEELPFLWATRDRAVGEAHYTLDSLRRLDDRVQAHLEGLRAADTTGWRLARARLENPEPGAIFSLGALAFCGTSRDQAHAALVAADATAGGARGLLSALAWIDRERAWPWTQLLLQARLPSHRGLAVSALGLLRAAQPDELLPALADGDEALRAQALRTAGECRLQALAEPARDLLQDADEHCRFRAAWALTLLGDAQGIEALLGFGAEPGPWTHAALALGLRAAPLPRARETVRQLARHPRAQRLAVLATGVLGDPQALPWLLDRMADPLLSRLAGEAFSAIAGVDLAYEDLALEAPEPPDEPELAEDEASVADDDLPPAHDDSLPWPDAPKLAAWWQVRKPSLASGQRYLCGEPVSVETALHVLRHGRQRDRAAAALELALLQSGKPLFDVKARGRAQWRSLAAWSS